MKSFFGNWLVEHGTPKPKKPRPSKEHFPTPPSSVASDASIAGMSDVSTIFQAPQTPSARSEASEQSDISQLSIAVPNIPQLDKDGFAVPTMKRGVNKSKRAGLQFPVARIKRLLKTGGYARRATTDASIYMTAVIEYLTAELLEVCGTIANEMGQKHIRARHLKLGLRNDAELGAAVRNSRNSRAQVPMIAVNNEDLPEPGDALRKGPASYSRPPSSASSSRKNSVQISTPSAAGKRQRDYSAQKKHHGLLRLRAAAQEAAGLRGGHAEDAAEQYPELLRRQEREDKLDAPPDQAHPAILASRTANPRPAGRARVAQTRGPHSPNRGPFQ